MFDVAISVIRSYKCRMGNIDSRQGVRWTAHEHRIAERILHAQAYKYTVYTLSISILYIQYTIQTILLQQNHTLTLLTVCVYWRIEIICVKITHTRVRMVVIHISFRFFSWHTCVNSIKRKSVPILIRRKSSSLTHWLWCEINFFFVVSCST